jgi:hypothetical protein
LNLGVVTVPHDEHLDSGVGEDVGTKATS